MTDYYDEDVWKKELIRTENLSEYKDFSLEEVQELLSSLKEGVDTEVYHNLCFRFESAMEPYEQYLGDPEVHLYGYKERTDKEKKARQKLKEDRARAKRLASEKGCTLYEAIKIMELKDRGLV